MNSINQRVFEISLIHSNSDEWLKGYFTKQWNGLNELACENGTSERTVKECIILARAMRKEILKRYNIIFFGRFCRIEPNTKYGILAKNS